MNRILILFLLISMVSCNSGPSEPERPVIAVSILPQKYIVSTIADTLADVHVIIPPGASPATWEATPSQMKDLGDAIVYFRIGHIGFEQAWISNIMDINPELPVVDLSTNIELRGIEFTHDDHKHHGVDPHIWMSARNMEVMSRKVFNELQKHFPDQKPLLRRNYSKLMLEIKTAGRYADDKLAEHAGESFLIFHPALGYFADAYGLEQLSIEYEGKEPSPAQMKEIIDEANVKGIKTIFVQMEFDKRNAEIIAKEIGGQVVVINPLSEAWPYEMENITNSLKKSFEDE